MALAIATAHRRMHAARDNVLEVTFTDAAGALVDDPGAVYRASFKTGWSASSVAFSRIANQESAGKALILIPQSDTAGLTNLPVVYVYEVLVTETGGQETTVEKGTVAFLPFVAP